MFPVTRTALGNSRVLAKAYDTALLDLDGVIFVGPHPIPHAVQSLIHASEFGMRLAYVTNNANRTPRAVADHLREIGIPASEDDVVTSAQAAARLAVDRFGHGAQVLVIGGDGLFAAVRERGLHPVESADDHPAVVLQGYSPTISWWDLAEASYAVERGVPWIATNTDLTLLTPRGTAPGNGTLVGVVGAATGATPIVAGKPCMPLLKESILRTGAQRPLMIGDRLDTDIEGANRAGIDSLLVFTGTTTPQQLLRAPEEHRPTYIAADLRGLLSAHPAVRVQQDGHECGGWQATIQDRSLELKGNGDRYDGLRALCATAWSIEEIPDAGKALAAIGL